MEDYRKIAIELGQTLINKAPETREDVERMLPELAESEDERIRKRIIHALHGDVLDIEETAKAIAWLEKQGEQKSVDKKGMNLVEEEMTPFQKKVFCIIDTAIEEEQGLKQVCDELLALASNEIKQEPAWSEEDERKVARIYSILGKAADTHAYSITCGIISDEECIELQDFLKSLRPQNRWKPSDEQIKSVKEAACYSSVFSEKTINNLISLSEQLKNLREEQL